VNYVKVPYVWASVLNYCMQLSFLCVLSILFNLMHGYLSLVDSLVVPIYIREAFHSLHICCTLHSNATQSCANIMGEPL
jgi:hypothetical protein